MIYPDTHFLPARNQPGPMVQLLGVLTHFTAQSHVSFSCLGLQVCACFVDLPDGSRGSVDSLEPFHLRPTERAPEPSLSIIGVAQPDKGATADSPSRSTKVR
jgi:hypothetical protein